MVIDISWLELTPNEERGFEALVKHDLAIDVSDFVEMCKAEILSVYGSSSAVLDDNSLRIVERNGKLAIIGIVWPVKEIV